MIIALVDFPNRTHDEVLDALALMNIPVLKGSLSRLKKQSRKYKKEELVIWDYPLLLEDGYADEVDKVLHVSYSLPAMSENELEMEENRRHVQANHYYVFPPCDIREKTPDEKKEKEKAFRSSVEEFAKQWREEAKGNLSTSDDVLFEITSSMVRKSGLDAKIEICALSGGALARYLYREQTIIINPFMIRLHSISTDEFQAIMAHELGHAFDTSLPHLNEQKSQLRRKLLCESLSPEIFEETFASYQKIVETLEENAYQIGKNHLPEDVPLTLYEELDRRNKEGYKQKFQTGKVFYLEKQYENMRQSSYQ